MTGMHTVAEVSRLIESGGRLLLAGSERALAQLPRGSWIGGTTAYFMTRAGGVVDRERVHVTELGHPVESVVIKTYDAVSLASLSQHYPESGCAFIILPGGSPVHLQFARASGEAQGLFNCALIGWIAGTHLDDLGKVSPKVFDGSTGECWADRAVVLHAAMPHGYVAKVEIINPFVQGSGDVLTFPQGGLEVRDCCVNGTARNFADYLAQASVDTRLPLVADYAGAAVNVSFQRVDLANRTVTLYAPVFENVEYRLAAPLADYAAELTRQLATRKDVPAFACNCILNFLYGELEGKESGNLDGPITFGEIAYLLLNQTLTYVCFEARTQPR